MLNTTHDHGRRPRRQPMIPSTADITVSAPDPGGTDLAAVLTPPSPPDAASAPPARTGTVVGVLDLEVPGRVVVVGKLAEVMLVLSAATTTRRVAAL